MCMNVYVYIYIYIYVYVYEDDDDDDDDDEDDDTCIPKFDEISFAAAAALRPVVFPSVLRRSCFRTITGLIAMLEHPMHTATMQISHC